MRLKRFLTLEVLHFTLLLLFETRNSLEWKFDEFTISETNKTNERYVFNSQNQLPDENFDPYVAAFRTLSKTCNFGRYKTQVPDGRSQVTKNLIKKARHSIRLFMFIYLLHFWLCQAYVCHRPCFPLLF